MALISAQSTKRIVPPHEPDAWYEVRPIRAGDFEGLNTDGAKITLGIDLLASLIVAWSYTEPVSRENVAALDLDTFIWIQGAIQTVSGVRSDDEKKDSGNGSSPLRLVEPQPSSQWTNWGS